MNESELEKRAKESPSKMISKVLDGYYRETYQQSLSKPKLGRVLCRMAIERIKANQLRGKDEDRDGYEFEKAIEKIRPLLSD